MKKKAEFVHNGLVKVPNIDIEYFGFHIIPKLDFGSHPYSNVNTYRKGYVVVQNGVNVMAGAIWSSSIVEAKNMINCHIEADGNSDLFWELLRETQGLSEYEQV